MSLKKQWNVLIIISVTSSEYRLEDLDASKLYYWIKKHKKICSGVSELDKQSKQNFFVATWVMLIAFENSHCCLFSM